MRNKSVVLLIIGIFSFLVTSSFSTDIHITNLIDSISYSSLGQFTRTSQFHNEYLAKGVEAKTIQRSLKQQTPSIAVDKTVGTDPSECATTSDITVGPNTDVYYCFKIRNTGNVGLTQHTLTDPQLSFTNQIINGTVAALEPAESLTIQNSNLDEYGLNADQLRKTIATTTVNVVTVVSLSGTTTVTNTDSALVTVNSTDFVITNLLASNRPDRCGGTTQVTAGSDIYYCLQITNIGSQPLTTYALSDLSSGFSEQMTDEIGASETIEYTAEFMQSLYPETTSFGPLTVNDIVTTTIDFLGTFADGTEISNSATSVVTIVEPQSIPSSPTPTATHTVTPTATSTLTTVPTGTRTPKPSTPFPTFTATSTPTLTPTLTPTPTLTLTATPTPTLVSPLPTPVIIREAQAPTPTGNPAEPTGTATPTPTFTPTPTLTPTPTITPEPTHTPVPTATLEQDEMPEQGKMPPDENGEVGADEQAEQSSPTDDAGTAEGDEGDTSSQGNAQAEEPANSAQPADNADGEPQQDPDADSGVEPEGGKMVLPSSSPSSSTTDSASVGTVGAPDASPTFVTVGGSTVEGVQVIQGADGRLIYVVDPASASVNSGTTQNSISPIGTAEISPQAESFLARFTASFERIIGSAFVTLSVLWFLCGSVLFFAVAGLFAGLFFRQKERNRFQLIRTVPRYPAAKYAALGSHAQVVDPSAAGAQIDETIFVRSEDEARPNTYSQDLTDRERQTVSTSPESYAGQQASYRPDSTRASYTEPYTEMSPEPAADMDVEAHLDDDLAEDNWPASLP